MTSVNGSVGVWGDPHIDVNNNSNKNASGNGDGDFDFQGVAGHNYNMLSDANISVNSKFGKFGTSDTATVQTKMGISVRGDEGLGEDQIYIDAEGRCTVNGEDAKFDENGRMELEHGGGYIQMEKDGSISIHSFQRDENGVVQRNEFGQGIDEYKISVSQQKSGDTKYLDMVIDGYNTTGDGTAATGIAGQFLDGDDSNNKTDAVSLEADYNVGKDLFGDGAKEVYGSTDLRENEDVVLQGLFQLYNQQIIDDFKASLNKKGAMAGGMLSGELRLKLKDAGYDTENAKVTGGGPGQAVFIEVTNKVTGKSVTFVDQDADGDIDKIKGHNANTNQDFGIEEIENKDGDWRAYADQSYVSDPNKPRGLEEIMVGMANKAEHFYDLAQNLLDDLGSMGVTDIKSAIKSIQEMTPEQRAKCGFVVSADGESLYRVDDGGKPVGEALTDEQFNIITTNEVNEDGTLPEGLGLDITPQEYKDLKANITGLNQTSMGEMQKSMILFTWYMAQGEIEKGAAKNLTSQMQKVGQGLAQS